MHLRKGLLLAVAASFAATALSCLPASAAGEKKPTPAMLAKCSDEANAKGLYVHSGKGEARKAFRAQCVRKLMGQNS
jgi:hypothetical protein